MQADLAERKEQVTRLNERLYQLNEVCSSQLRHNDTNPCAEFLISRANFPSNKADEDDLGVGNGEDLLSEDDVRETESKGDIVPSAESKNATISTGAPLDRRKPFSSGDDLQRNALFGKPQALADAGKEDIGITTSSDVNPNLSQTEKLLSHNRMEQEDLTASLLDMAHALKASSQAFSSSLESEKEILDRASEGLEKNTTGMEAAGKRMGALRRMSEGRGWLGRMLMYAWIMGLMMIALIIVVVLPKFRF